MRGETTRRRPNPTWMTREDIAHDLQVSLDTVDTMVAQGKLPKPVYLTPRTPRFRRQAVDAMVSGTPKLKSSTSWDEAVNETVARVAQARAANSKVARGRHR